MLHSYLRIVVHVLFTDNNLRPRRLKSAKLTHRIKPQYIARQQVPSWGDSRRPLGHHHRSRCQQVQNASSTQRCLQDLCFPRFDGDALVTLNNGFGGTSGGTRRKAYFLRNVLFQDSITNLDMWGYTLVQLRTRCGTCPTTPWCRRT